MRERSSSRTICGGRRMEKASSRRAAAGSTLAASTAATLTAEGWTIAETGNYAESQVAATTVYYGTAAGADDAAQEIAQQLGATATELPATLTGFGNGVIVMVTQ